MKLLAYRSDGTVGIGALRGEKEIVSLTAVAPDVLSLIRSGEEGLERARALAAEAEEGIPLDSVHLLAPIPLPQRNIMCLGKNYAAHAEESQRTWGDKIELPEFPLIFTKAPTTVNGPYDDIPYDANVSTAIDFEAELVVVIGRSGKNIPREKAMDFIFGYTVMNDATARDIQRRHKQFFKGKSLDGHGPLGPWIVTADEISDPHDLRVTCHVNGVKKQDGHTSQMIFDIPEIIAQLSFGMTLLPGDLIATGTPSGVGFARTPPEFLRPGDVVTCTVEGVGTIRNRIADSLMLMRRGSAL